MCGSCWAFSATGSLEGQHAKAKKLTSLSEQNLLDCDKVDHACFGGLMDNAFNFIMNNHGIDSEASYPYHAVQGAQCLYKQKDNGATCTGHVDIPTGSEGALKHVCKQLQSMQFDFSLSIKVDAFLGRSNDRTDISSHRCQPHVLPQLQERHLL